jgi:hypothetical protein
MRCKETMTTPLWVENPEHLRSLQVPYINIVTATLWQCRVASSSQAITFAGLYLSRFLLEDRNRIPIGVHGDGTTLLINTLNKEMLVSHVVAPEWWILEKQICAIAHDLEILSCLQLSPPRRIDTTDSLLSVLLSLPDSTARPSPCAAAAKPQAPARYGTQVRPKRNWTFQRKPKWSKITHKSTQSGLLCTLNLGCHSTRNLQDFFLKYFFNYYFL